MGHQCCPTALSHISLLFPRVLHLPLQTDIPLRDRQPLFVQTQACPVLCSTCVCVSVCVCVCACVCFYVSTSACLCQASPEWPGNQRKNRTGHYLNSLQQNFWRVFLKHHIINSGGQHTQWLCSSTSIDTHSQKLLLRKWKLLSQNVLMLGTLSLSAKLLF